MPFDDEQKTEINTLIGGALEKFQDGLMQKVNTANSGTVAALKKEFGTVVSGIEEKFKAAPPSDPGEKLTLKSLQTQIGELKGQLSTRDREALQAKSHSAVVGAAAGKKFNLPQHFASDFVAHYGGENVVAEGDQWFVKSAAGVRPLGDAIDEYAKTEKGKLYIPVEVGGGSGTTTPSKQGKQNSGDEESLEDMLSAAIAENA